MYSLYKDYENPKIRSFLGKKNQHKSFSLTSSHPNFRNIINRNQIDKKRIKINYDGKIENKKLFKCYRKI